MNNYYEEEGYCIQEGIPTPDKPVEIKTKVIGKNLLETVEYSQQKEIERLHSIIKEVRELIKELKDTQMFRKNDLKEVQTNIDIVLEQYDDILEILDKGE